MRLAPNILLATTAVVLWAIADVPGTQTAKGQPGGSGNPQIILGSKKGTNTNPLKLDQNSLFGNAGQTPAPESKAPAGSDEQILRAAGLSTDADSLLDFFRERMQPISELDKLVTLARQLGDADAGTRLQAAAKLIAHGSPAAPALRHVLNELDNPAAAQQARHCLAWIDNQQGAELTGAAARLLALRKPAAATATLLAYLPLSEDDAVVDAIKASLIRLATGKADPLLLAALRDPLPMRRAIAVEVLAASGHSEVFSEARKLLADPKPQVRLRAALALAQRLDDKAVGVLIELLAELPLAERRLAETALQQLAGEWAPNPVLVGEDDLSRKIRREAWAGWWRTLDGPALLTAFRQRTLTREETNHVFGLIADLADQSFAKRERASMELTKLGTKVVGLLREAAASKDLEQAQRAQTCLKRIALQEEKEKLPTAAARLLAVRKPVGACEALLGFLPFTDDQFMRQEVAAALKHLAVIDGKPDPAVIAALADPLAERRLAASEALVAAGGATLPAVRKLLTDADPNVRLQVALALVRAQDKDAVPALIELLAVLPRGVTGEAEQLLARLAGPKRPMLLPGDDAAARKKLRDQWQGWWQTNGAAADWTQLEVKPGVAGLIVIAELGGNAPAAGKKGKVGGPLTDRIVALDRNGKVHWEITNLQNPLDFQLLPGERVLITEYGGNRVTERDFKGRILWEVKVPRPPVSAQRLPNGNTFIATYYTPTTGGGKLLEVDRAGQTVASFDNVHDRNNANPPAGKVSAPLIRAASKLPDGHMICLLSKGICVRLDAAGKEVKRFSLPLLGGSSAVVTQVPHFAGNIDVTAKGHLVVALEDNTVAEFDLDGKRVWQANAPVARATRLPNGNTLIALQTGAVVELNGTGKIEWQYQPPAGYQALRARQTTEATFGTPVQAKEFRQADGPGKIPQPE